MSPAKKTTGKKKVAKKSSKKAKPVKAAKGEAFVPLEAVGEMKSPGRLDWIWTKIRIGKMYPFPLVPILLIGVPLIPVILLTLGFRLPISFVDLPLLKGVLNYMGIYSNRDLFVNATWVFWWPLFIGAIFFFKRLWCGGFCPFGLVTDIGNFLGQKLRGGREARPVNIVKYIFVGFFVFKGLGYLHDAINITNSAVLTAEFVVFFLVFSFTIGLIAPRRSFCRLFCFLGSLPHLFGRLSIYTLETDRSKCDVCVGQWCVTGSKAKPAGKVVAKEPMLNVDGCPMFINVPQLSHTESNRNCIQCGNCVKNCPYDAIHYKPKVPGYELYKGIDLNNHETIFILGLLPLLAMFVAMEGGLLGTFATFFNFPATAHWAISGAFYVLAIVVTVVGYFMLAGVGSLVLGVDLKLALKNFGYILLPFTYLAMFRDILITYFLRGSFLENRFPDIIVSYPFIDTFLILVGAMWSVYMGYRISQVTMSEAGLEVNADKVKVHSMLWAGGVAMVTWYWFSLIFPEHFAVLENEYFIHFIWPFVVAVGLIGGFVVVARWIVKRKAVAQ